jgi:hypothetical protein
MRLVIAILLASHVAVADTPDQHVLKIINAYRKAAGLPAVALDAKLSKGCMQHADDMLQTRGTDAMAGLNAHTERMNLPGATPEGAACGKAADLFPGVADFTLAVDGWMAGIYHRRPILDPGLVKIGFGYAKLPDGTYMTALMFDQPPQAKTGWPVAYPADKQTGVPLEYGNEIPNPVPKGRGGYPITLQFPPFDKITKVTATLTDDKGTAIDIYLSDPEHPATSFGQYGVISVIPKARLRPATTYSVAVGATWNGKHQTWKWQLTTVGLRAVDASDEAALIAALNQPSHVTGTVQYGGMMNTEVVFLALAQGKRMVSVLIPRDVWNQLSKKKPETFKGAKVEVEATPQLVEDKFINLTISTASQLTFVR